jgi:hypothetical protein
MIDPGYWVALIKSGDDEVIPDDKQEHLPEIVFLVTADRVFLVAPTALHNGARPSHAFCSSARRAGRSSGRGFQ